MTSRLGDLFWGIVLCALLLAPHAQAQDQSAGPSSVVDVSRDLPAALPYKGRLVEQVQIIGNTQVSSAIILNLVRTREGQPFDPATVVEDYQRIYRLNKFSNIEPRIEPTARGVIVTFVVTEQREIRSIRFRGNVHVPTPDLRTAAALSPGEAIDQFRINLAETEIEKTYYDKNFPFAHVDLDPDALTKAGDVVFNITEGPMVRITKVDFIGNYSLTAWRLKDQIKTAYYIPIFRAGTFDPETVDTDVTVIRKYYQDKGFFDVRVGRKLTFSADQTSLQVTFVIDEGPRYVIDHVLFQGNVAVPEGQIRKGLNMVEGRYYDKEVLDRDVRQIVKDYSPFGYIYESLASQVTHADYLHIDTRTVFKTQRGHLNLVYVISEGKTYYVGRIIVKGNSKTQDKVILRELRFFPGQKYDSSEVADAIDRLRGTPYFKNVTVTPIGDDPSVRDVLVEVEEQKTTEISAGVGINSNGGIGGDFSYEQKNFDILNPPPSIYDLFDERSFTGAGQDFRASFQPGTVFTNADISVSEPWLFDQPYSLGGSIYLHNAVRESYVERRLGGDVIFGRRFSDIYSAALTLRAEDVDIRSIQDKYLTDPDGNIVDLPNGDPAPYRSIQILDGAGHHTLTSAALEFRRDTTNHGPITYEGNNSFVELTKVGALGGTVDYNQIYASTEDYEELAEDLLDRKTVLNTHLNMGDDWTNAPFYERFYGGGIGSIRGIAFRGAEPRDGVDNDPVGGDFEMTGGVEVDFPIAEDILRGDVFSDAGDFETDARIGIIRTSVGAGFRLAIPFLGNQPLSVDFAAPLTLGRNDHPQIISFSFGINR
jgi:outer membrane protein insertion porin family